MNWITLLYFIYTFLAFYMLVLYFLLYIQNKKQIYEYVEPNKIYPLSIVVPCFNVEKTIHKTIEALLAQDYKGIKKIILVDDCSKDNTFRVLKEYEKKYSIIKAVQTPKNTGRAAGCKNYGAKFVKTEFIAFTDDDSEPRKDAISKMVGFFNDKEVGAVTSRVLVKNRENYLSRAQAIEYKVIAFTRKLMGFIDSIYVTNGPLSIYRMKGFKQVKGFDETNWTEDIELTWAFVSKGWKVQISIPAKVYTTVPSKVKAWFKQRIRWNVGGIQTVSKYKTKILETGMLGRFILPFFVASWMIGISGLFLLAYRMSKYFASKYLITKYSVAAEIALIRMEDITFNATLLFLFGLILFTLGLTYLVMSLVYSREEDYPTHGILDIFIYSLFYLLMYPPILIYSFYKYMRGLNSW